MEPKTQEIVFSDCENENTKIQEELCDNMIDVETESINASFIKRYERYSDRLKEREINLNLEEAERKVKSLDPFIPNKEWTKAGLSPFSKIRQVEINCKAKEDLDLCSDGQNCQTTLEIISKPSPRVVDSTRELTSSSDTISKPQSSAGNRFTLRRRTKERRLFEEFIVIGIERNGLEYIDNDELCLSPKIIYNYPNKLDENELKFNILFLKNFCFNEGVKVTRTEICTDEEYECAVLEKNFFSKPKSLFCLVQQVSPQDIQKYFIFGMKFDDFYVTPLKVKSKKETKTNYVSIFSYEKTYLFISFKPLLNLFHIIFRTLLQVKKINFLHNMSDFSCIFVRNRYTQFIEENSEKEGEQINEILNFAYNRRFPLFQEVIVFKSELNHLAFEYTYPNPFNKIFLAIDWLCDNFLNLIDPDTFFAMLILVLTENSCIFISSNIQLLTSIVLGFTYLLKPFKWPFILIPNLPIDLMSMVESPVPFLIGVLGNEDLLKSLIGNRVLSHCQFIFITTTKIELCTTNNTRDNFTEPYLKNLKESLRFFFDKINNNTSQDYEDYKDQCKKIYKKVFEHLKSELASKVENLAKEECSSNINAARETIQPTKYAEIKNKYLELLHYKDKSFGAIFSQTQIFLNYYDTIRKRMMK